MSCCEKAMNWHNNWIYFTFVGHPNGNFQSQF